AGRKSVRAISFGWLGVVAAVGYAGGAFGQQDFSSVQIETVPVADGLYMLVGAGGNIALSTGDDGTVIVDTQFAPLTEKISAAIRAACRRAVALEVNTH